MTSIVTMYGFTEYKINIYANEEQLEGVVLVESGTLYVTYQDSNVNLWNTYKQARISSRNVEPKSKWKYYRIAYINGQKWYRTGDLEWINGQYVSLTPPTIESHKPVESGNVYCILENCSDGYYGARHNGTDISNNGGSTVYSIYDGVVDMDMSFGSPDNLGKVAGISYRINGIVDQTGSSLGGQCSEHLHI